MIVSFSGVDGTGKSTQAAWLRRQLEARGVRVQELHLTRWTLVYRFGNRRNRGQKTASGAGASGRRVGALEVVGRRWVAWVDVLRFRALARCVHRRGEVLICDRYFTDLALQGLYRGYYSRSFVQKYLRVAPVPFVSILLQVDASTACRREGGEHPASYYEEKLELYDSVSPPWPHQRISSLDREEVEQALSLWTDTICNALSGGRD